MDSEGRAPLTFAAAVTPLTRDGAAVDLDGVSRLADFYASSELDGLLVLGTTGEGVLLSVVERRKAAEAFLSAAGSRLSVVVHCGAQSTRDTSALCAHAAEIGASGVAVIAPPYYAIDERSLERHFAAAADASAPVPFYVYEFAARSGYAVPLPVIARLRKRCSNLTGIKVSDSPFDAVEPYLRTGLDVFIGAEHLIDRGLRLGAAGAVSGLAAALPELTVRAVRTGIPEDSAAAAHARAAIQRFPFQAALKRLLRHRGIAIESTVCAPLRDLDDGEVAEFDRVASRLLEETLTGSPSPS